MISLVIPCYTMNDHLEELAIRAAATYREQVDELIITEDSGRFSRVLFDLSDVYIRGKKNLGFTANVNRGWRLAKGDYVMIVNSDTELYRGQLKDLCIPDKVTSPIIVNQEIPFLAGPFWCAPKEVTEKYGMLNEAMKTYASDSDYDNRVRDIFQKVESVKIYHEMAQTVTAAGVEGGEEAARDNKIYHDLIAKGEAK